MSTTYSPNKYTMNFDSFSHGQIISKLWLCEHLEPLLSSTSKVLILGSWYNILGSVMLTRNRDLYQSILGIDIDASAIEIADKLNITWHVEKKLTNITADANEYDLEGYDVIINCSPEHMEQTVWFDKLPKNTIICIQSSSIVDKNEPWLIKQPTPTYEDFCKKYELSRIYYTGIKKIQYDTWGYDRYMIIGEK